MSSYYREHLSYPAQEPQHYHQDVPDNQQQDDQDDQYAQGPIRRCSVRGCSKVLAPDYALKMCEQCREKHRIYANTKRAKRKLEKAALGTQTGVTWVPSNVHENNPQSSPHGQHVSESPEPQVSPQYSFSPAWDNSAIDPRLSSQPTTSSELAGALTLPDIHGQQLDPDSMSHSLSEDGQHDVPTLPPPSMPDHSSYSSPTPSNPKTPVSAAVFTPTHGEISAKSISEAVLQMGVAALPARYCSIKGCKAVVPANSYFKMCEPCRNRYRSYGTTKRAKWRREKEVAVAELQKLQVDEVQRRVETGVPIIPDANVSSVNWSALVQVVQNEAGPSTQPPPQLSPGTGQTVFSQTTPKGITPRMCTVSHCREILPGDYEYLRCERHRIQNRHHSKLKRVRDKESKAIAYHDWAAAVNQHGTHRPYQTRGSHRDSQFPPPDMQFLDDSGSEFDDFDDEYDQVVQAPPEGEAENGIPPAARGSRRTNHSCSNKTCCNLLSLENPWRMCEFCRAHDRETRRAKTLRDGAFLAELLTRTSEAMSSLESDKKRANKKDGGVGGGEILEGVRGERRWEDRQREPRRQEDKPPTLVFMEPVLAQQTGVTSDTPPSSGPVSLSFILADELGNITEPPDAPLPPTSNATQQPNDETDIPPSAPVETHDSPMPAPAPAPAKTPAEAPISTENVVKKKRSSKRKDKVSNDVAQQTSSSTNTPFNPNFYPYPPPPGQISPSSSHDPKMPPPPLGMPPYMPYYMPPYPMPPYPPPPGMRYPQPPHPLGNPPPGMASTDPYGPSPMFQPPPGYPPYPYPPYPPYPYPPGPYGQPYPPPGYPMPSFPPPPETASMYPTGTGQEPSASTTPHNNITPYGAPPPPSQGSNSGRQKRALPDSSADYPNKRSEAAETVSPPESNVDTSQSAFIAPLVPPPGLQAAQAQATSPVSTTTDSEKRSQTCANKNCHRDLPLSTAGTLCDKCKERLKKRQMKVKQKFKLEPRKLLAGAAGQSGSSSRQDTVNDPPPSDVSG